MRTKPLSSEPNIVYDDLLLLMDSIQDYAIIRLDTDGNITSWNRGAEKIKGYNAEEVIGKHFSIFYLPDDIAAGAPQANLSLAALVGSYTRTGYRVRKDGSTFWGDMVITALYTSDGKLRGFVKITRDITKQKELSDEVERLHHLAQSEITEQLKLIQRENADYKHALDASAIVAITDRKGIITYVNDNFCKISKYTKDELIGQDHRIINSGYHSADFIRDLWETIKSGNIWKGEFRNRAKDGSFYWVAGTIVPFIDNEGRPFKYISIRTDITARKREEEYSKSLEKLLRKATDLAQVGAWEIDLVNSTLHWSDMTKWIHEVLLEFEPDLEKGINFYKEGESRLLINEVIEQAVSRGKSFDKELQIVTAKGNTKWVRVNGEPEFFESKCVRIVGSFQDIDVRKKAELAAKCALEDKKRILESIGDAFFAVDRDWVVTYWNKTAENVLHVHKEDIVGFKLWDVIVNADKSDSFKKFHEALNTGSVVQFEDFSPRLDKWFEINAYPAENGLSVYLKDITERKIAEKHLIALNYDLQVKAKLLAISNAELEQFAYVASHDLQEPLRMVTGFLTQLERKYDSVIDDKAKRYIHFAVDGAKRMRQIILDLLDFSRLRTMDEDLEDVNLNKVVDEIIALFRKQIGETKAEIKCGILPNLHVYRAPIRQVFQNLIGNSLKYSRRDTPCTIVISCEEQTNDWLFAVKDNGIGIEQEYFEKIFVIFQRLHNKDEYSGTGMGLAITKKIIENLGGKIWVESEPGVGSTFYFTLSKKLAK